jgi:hypothetical protein
MNSLSQLTEIFMGRDYNAFMNSTPRKPSERWADDPAGTIESMTAISDAST